MRFRLMVPCLAIALAVGACEEKDDPTGGSTARVRFVNALTGATGNLLLTANGTAVGSQQGFGTSASTCTSVTSGSNRPLAFGTANAGGTGIGTSLGTMNANFTSGSTYTVVATGSATNPKLLVLDNTTSAATGSNAKVRVVNATGSSVDFFATQGATLGTATSANVAGGSSGTFATIPVANNTLTFRNAGGTTQLFTTTGAFTAGQNYTVILLPTSTGAGFQTMTVPNC